LHADDGAAAARRRHRPAGRTWRHRLHPAAYIARPTTRASPWLTVGA
jgi:hypothetical protein